MPDRVFFPASIHIIISRRHIRAGVLHGQPRVVRGGDPAPGADPGDEGGRRPRRPRPQAGAARAHGHRRQQVRQGAQVSTLPKLQITKSFSVSTTNKTFLDM